jgi:hypothetical protein
MSLSRGVHDMPTQFNARLVLVSGVIICLNVVSGCMSMPGAVSSWQDDTRCPTCSAPHQCATCTPGGPGIPTAVPAATAWHESVQTPVAAANPPACQPLPVVPGVPPEAMPNLEATFECEKKLEKLQAQINQLTESHHILNAMRDQKLQTFENKLESLTEEVGFWKTEVERLDAAATAQHERDMQSLDALIDLVAQIPVTAPIPSPQSLPAAGN